MMLSRMQAKRTSLVLKNSFIFLRKDRFAKFYPKDATKQIYCLTNFNFSSERNFSALSNKDAWFQKNLQKQSPLLNAVSFISTNIDSDKYHVVYTNPASTSSTNLTPVSSEATNITTSSTAELSSSLPVSDSADIALSLGSELQSAAEVIEPTLASLGLCNYTPVGLVQMFLEYLHVSCHMPWWAAIAACTVTARVLLFPILIKTQKNAINMSNSMPQLQFLQAKFGEARRSGNTMEAGRYANEIMIYMKEHNISPFKNALLPLTQAPIFISFFLALRAMAKVPVESMKYGGLWWVTDLTIPDPYYILPVVSCSTLYIILKLGAESGMKMENLKMAKYVLQALPVIVLPFCINFPAAVLYYWVTTNFCTLAFVSFLKIQPVRTYFNLPQQKPIDPKFVLPKKGLVAGVKDAYEDQKVLAAVEDRRRIDDVRFQQAGTGPVPRTYSYDPTKPRPANAAAIAAKKKT